MTKSRLVVVGDDGQTREFPIPMEHPAELGRAMHGWDVVLRRQGEETALGIRDAMVSRRHALLYFESDRLMIKDVGSTNGTVVNNRLLPGWRQKVGSEAVEIVADSIVRVGSTEIDVIPIYRDDLSGLSTAHELELQAALPPDTSGQSLVNVFRLVLDINTNYCSARTPVKELLGRLDALRGSVARTELEARADDLYRRTAAQLFEDECLGEEHIRRVRAFCAGLVEALGARFSERR